MFPYELDICITNRCNLRCRYCYAEKGNAAPRGELGPAGLKAGFDVFAAAAVLAGAELEKISVSGGEPLLRLPALAGLCAHIGRSPLRGLPLEIFTNGLLLTPGAAAALQRPGLRMQLSIDGAGRRQDSGRVLPGGGGSYRALAAALAALSPEQRRALGVAATVHRRNFRGLADGIRFFFESAFGRVSLSFAIERGWTEAEFAALAAELAEVRAFLRRPPRKYGEHFGGVALVSAGPGRRSLEEFTRFNEVSLGPDGYFYPCAVISASAAALDAGTLEYYRIGGLRRGFDEEKFCRLRREAFTEIVSYGRRRYLGELTAVYYMSKLRGWPLGEMLAACSRLAGLVRAADLDGQIYI